MSSRTFQLPWDTADGATVPVFVRELTGGGPGPVLALIGGEHGIELTGPAAIDLLCRELEGQAFRGTVLAVPCIAPVNIAYRHHTLGQTRGKPYTLDLPYNSYGRWPGDPTGDPADRLAALIWAQVITRADVVLNFHCWNHITASAAGVPVAHPAAMAIARNLGLPFIVESALSDSSLAGAALAAGKPSMLIELQAQWWINPTLLPVVRQGLRNVMAGLGMLDAPIMPPARQYVVGTDEYLVRAPHAGLFIPLRANEETVAEGDLLGYLLDIYTGARTDIPAPGPGALWSIARQGAHADVTLEGMHAYADAGDLLALIKLIKG
jgi:predicted deacylase